MSQYDKTKADPESEPEAVFNPSENVIIIRDMCDYEDLLTLTIEQAEIVAATISGCLALAKAIKTIQNRSTPA